MHSARYGTIQLTSHSKKPNTTTKNLLVPPLNGSPLPLPRQAEPKQKLQHEKKNKNKKKTQKCKKKYMLFFRLQSETDLNRVMFSPQTDRMETTNISRTLKCSPEDGEEKHLFCYFVHRLHITSHNLVHSKSIRGERDSRNNTGICTRTSMANIDNKNLQHFVATYRSPSNGLQLPTSPQCNFSHKQHC